MSGTFNETYIDFDAEVSRLDEEIADIDEQLEQTDNDDHAQVLVNQRQQLQSQRQGVIWARDHAAESDDFEMWDEDVAGITLGGLRASTYGRMQDDLTGSGEAGRGTARTLYVADGTVDAPYVDDDMSDRERVATVGKLHPMFNQWVEDRVSTLMDPEGNVSASSSSPEATSTTTQTDG